MTTASATTSVPSAVLLTPASSAPFTPRLEPVLSLAGDGPISDMGDHSGRIAISAAQSGGAFTLIEANVAFQGGPPPHIHTLEDETFYIVEGSFEFWVGGQIILANPGDTIFAPRHVPHAWRCVSQGGGRAFGMATPGENFEQFFVALGGMGLRGKPTPSQIADVCALGERHGLQMLPPSVLQGDSPSALVASASIAPASATPAALVAGPRLAEQAAEWCRPGPGQAIVPRAAPAQPGSDHLRAVGLGGRRRAASGHDRGAPAAVGRRAPGGLGPGDSSAAVRRERLIGSAPAVPRRSARGDGPCGSGHGG
jgi:quercetin dioxygenase-like cupin family protein